MKQYVIHKQQLAYGMQHVHLPLDANIVAFRLQGVIPTIWYAVPVGGNPITTPRCLGVFRTGEVFPAYSDRRGYAYIGTDMTPDGSHVAHCVALP
jgi:hypothetical protein